MQRDFRRGKVEFGVMNRVAIMLNAATVVPSTSFAFTNLLQFQ